MIPSLKDDRIFSNLGGQFRFASLVQHRIRELMEGSRPLVERQVGGHSRSDFEVAVAEIVEGKITYEDQAPENVEEAAS